MIDLAPLQTAAHVALSAAPATYPAYDAVLQGTAYPYLVIGEVTALPDEDMDVASVDASFQIHAWSRSAGKKQVYAMLEFARDRLDNQAIGGGVWACSEEFAEVMEDPTSTAASRLYHGIARYRLRAN